MSLSGRSEAPNRGVKVHKTKGFLRRSGLVLILFILSSFHAIGSDRGAKIACLARLQHPSHEIYVSSQGASHLLPDRTQPTVGRRSARSRVELLNNSPHKEKYQRILRVASTHPHLYRLTLFVLSEIELLPQKPANHSEWIQFLNGSSVEDLNHRIYEGFHAISLLNTKVLHVAFEPKVGFFSDNLVRKSMDLEVRDPQSGRILAYKEIKRIYKYHNVKSVLKSILGKSTEIRPKVGDDVELSGIIYIGSPRVEGATAIDETQLRIEFERAAFNARISLEKRAEDGVNHGLDSLLLIDLELERYAKIYLRDDEITMTEGEYPLESAFRFLSFNND